MAGMRTELNLMADAPGRFRGRNTQFSGDGFSGQTFSAIATDAAGYDAFVAEARASSETLSLPTFEVVSQPTANGPEKLFSGVAPGLFSIIMQSHGTMPHDHAAPATTTPAAAAHTGH